MTAFSASVSTLKTTLALTLLISSTALASGAHDPSFADTPPTKPSTRYSGGTPIDLSNGLVGANGTVGLPNKDYEAWAESPYVVAGMSEMAYSFKQKGEFVRTLNEQIIWGDSAIRNYQGTTQISRAEGMEHAKAAVAALTPALDKLKDATKRADGAKEKDWANSESDARRALIEFRTVYTQQHKNPQWIPHKSANAK